MLDAMLPYYLARYGNPHSRTHLYGWESDQAVETARSQIADLIGASQKEIVFTSGATESNNISIKGVRKFYKEKKRLVVTRQTEHKCVLDSCRHLQEEGFEVTYLPVGNDGIVVDLEKLREGVDKAGYSISGGDGSWRKRRWGMMMRGLGVRRSGCWMELGLSLMVVVVNGSVERRNAGNLNLSFACVEGESLLMGLKEVAVSSGSACTSASLEEPSYVSRALGVDEDMAHTSIRFGIDRRAIELTVREMSPLYEMMKEGSDINGHNTDWLIH